MLFQFVWQGPIGKVKKEVLFKDYTNGGLKKINPTAFINSLKSTWIRRAIQSEKIKPNIESNHVDLELLTTAGDKYNEISIENCKNEFWKDVLHAWQYILSKTTTYDSWASFLHNPIWYNNKLKFNHTCFSYKDWYRKGVRIVNDLVKEIGEFYSFAEFERKYNININFLKYHGFISCLKKYSENFDRDNVSKI
jgi:hypothetical protein